METIEGWLGVGPGGELRLSGRMPVWCVLPGVTLVAAGSWLLHVFQLHEDLRRVWWGVSCLGVGLGLAVLGARLGERRRPVSVVANGHGLRLGTGAAERWCSWGEVRALEGSASAGWNVTTADDCFALSYADERGRRLLETIRAVLDARACGRLAAVVAGVPSSALSRLGAPEEDDAARGLSVSGRDS